MIDKGITYDIPQLAKPKGDGSKRQGYRGSDYASISSSSGPSYGGMGSIGSGGSKSSTGSGSKSTGSGTTNSGNGGGGGPTARDLAMGMGGKQPKGTVTKVEKLSKATGTDFGGGVQRDTGLEKQRQKNIQTLETLKNLDYKDVKKTIPTLTPELNLLGSATNLLGEIGFTKNKEFFIENVAGKHGYGYGVEDFEQYMRDRLSGEVGAYGNEAQGQKALRELQDAGSGTSGILEVLLTDPDTDDEILQNLPKGFTYVPYSNQIVIAPGREGLASLTGGEGFLSSII